VGLEREEKARKKTRENEEADEVAIRMVDIVSVVSTSVPEDHRPHHAAATGDVDTIFQFASTDNMDIRMDGC